MMILISDKIEMEVLMFRCEIEINRLSYAFKNFT